MKLTSRLTTSSNHNNMKLVITRTDIENAFVYKYGVQRHEIEIDIVSQPIVPSFPKVNSIHDSEVRIAIASIFDEAMTIQDNYREGREISPNKISLIKAVRTLVPNTSLKDAKDYVENNLLNHNF
jgi:hypothetical protein